LPLPRWRHYPISRYRFGCLKASQCLLPTSAGLSQERDIRWMSMVAGHPIPDILNRVCWVAPREVRDSVVFSARFRRLAWHLNVSLGASALLTRRSTCSVVVVNHRLRIATPTRGGDMCSPCSGGRHPSSRGGQVVPRCADFRFWHGALDISLAACLPTHSHEGDPL